MTTSNADLPAMPNQVNGGDLYGGLTKREQAAIHMMAARRIANPLSNRWDIAKDAVHDANALFAELEKQP